MPQKLIFTNHVEQAIDMLVGEYAPDDIYVLVDHNTAESVLPRLQSLCRSLSGASIISVAPGDDNKTLDALSHIWRQLSENGATRRSLLVNIGGGMITDMGAFAAATFKRGLRFINVPTTLLGAVDAAYGGKTGINFNGLKNEIGVFKKADAVIISTTFLTTLPHQEINSGYAEMIKHAMIADGDMLAALLRSQPTDHDPETLLALVEQSSQVKTDIVNQDPEEKSIRKALNFGHTAGHAFEELALERQSPIPHGYAVAYGMVVETILSVIKKQFPIDRMRTLAAYVFKTYRAFPFTCDDYGRLVDLMRHDKKNHKAGDINFTLLKNVGEVEIDCTATEQEITAAFDIYREELQK